MGVEGKKKQKPKQSGTLRKMKSSKTSGISSKLYQEVNLGIVTYPDR